MKIATWNVNSLRIRLPHVLDWLNDQQPDILALQETKLCDADFPVQNFNDVGYHARYSGQKTYNGVALLSRHPAIDWVTDLPGLADPQRRVLAATLGKVRVINLYVPNGRAIGSGQYAYKLAWLEHLIAWVKSELVCHPYLVLLGDFNIAPEDRDVHDPRAWEGQILCSEPERTAFRRLLKLGLSDAFRNFHQETGYFSWWDYRTAAFQRNRGLRIDHILISPALVAVCTACWIDRTPRRKERPSDHTPVIAEFNFSV